MFKFIIILFVLLSINVYSENLVIDCQNGDGWMFVNDHNIWYTMIPYNGKTIELDPGKYCIAFDHGGVYGFNGGIPGKNAEYHVIQILERKETVLKVKMKF